MFGMYQIIFIALSILLIGVDGFSDSAPRLGHEILKAKLRAQIEKLYFGASVEVGDDISLNQGDIPAKISSVRIDNDNSRGVVGFTCLGQNEVGEERTIEGAVSFVAKKPVWVATKRVLPGEALTADSFVKREIDISKGMDREIRGLILEGKVDFQKLEAKQTILEGQPLLSHYVQKTPDIRRGESVRIRLVSGEVALSTAGLADEPAYIDGQIHVTTLKTKRQLVGKLSSDLTVEVKL